MSVSWNLVINLKKACTTDRVSKKNWAKKFEIFVGHHKEISDGHIFTIEDLFINSKPSLKEFLKNALRSKGKICKKSEQILS